MAYLEIPHWGWFLAGVQVIGLLSAWLARLSEGSCNQVWCQRLFVACLAIMGMTTMAFVAVGTRQWLASGTTMSVMVLAAVWDFRSHASTTPLH